ncbi:hypothetical protein ACSBR2_035533 [Camellia fascicularis]
MVSLTSRLEHTVKPNAHGSYLAEFISTFLFVFAAVGSVVSSRKMMADATTDSSALVAVAVANAFALSVAVYPAANIFSRHVNLAVMFGMAVRGHITIPMAICHLISQLVGSVMACLFLKVTTVLQHVLVHGIPQEMTGFRASILDGVMTFGANVLASRPFTGGSMNPAYSFGSALVRGNFKNHVVYSVGPLISAALAGILYGNGFFSVQVPGIADGVGV